MSDLIEQAVSESVKSVLVESSDMMDSFEKMIQDEIKDIAVPVRKLINYCSDRLMAKYGTEVAHDKRDTFVRGWVECDSTQGAFLVFEVSVGMRMTEAFSGNDLAAAYGSGAPFEPLYEALTNIRKTQGADKFEKITVDAFHLVFQWKVPLIDSEDQKITWQLPGRMLPL